MPKADAKEQAILIDTAGAERGKMKRIGNECVSEYGHALVQSIGGIFFYFDHRFEQAARLLESLEPLLHLARGNLLSIQRAALGEELGAFEGTDDHRIETGVAHQPRRHL